MITRHHNVDLTPYNTFRIKATASELIEYDANSDLEDLFCGELSSCKKWMQIGGGSNLLFLGDYAGTLLHSRIKGIVMEPLSTSGSVLVTVGSGVTLDELIRYSIDEGLWGIENLSDIPGEVGAAAVQNVGAYGVEFGNLVDRVECFDTVSRTFTLIDGHDCRYGYRYSRFKGQDKGRYIITRVTLCLSRKRRPVLTYGPLSQLDAANVTLADIALRVSEIRAAKLPSVSEVGSAGSFFKNPIVTLNDLSRASSLSGMQIPYHEVTGSDGAPNAKISAAWLIDKAGLKGSRLGSATTWPSQPLVIVNSDGNASAAEIVGLENALISGVKSKFGITLEPEVEHVS